MSSRLYKANVVCPNCTEVLWEVDNLSEEHFEEELCCIHCGWMRLTIGFDHGAPWMCAYRSIEKLNELRALWGFNDPKTVYSATFFEDANV